MSIIVYAKMLVEHSFRLFKVKFMPQERSDIWLESGPKKQSHSFDTAKCSELQSCQPGV